jgi:hypothetical protein
MVDIRSGLQLTDRGEFLFNASQPELNGAAEFNSYCRDNQQSEVAVLGCYRTNKIYVYNITDARLKGIRELTSAHELLHANWARMDEAARNELVSALTQVYDTNQGILGDELNTYSIDERQEELYVRAGTEIASLPAKLEQHYATIFKDQDHVVAFYDSYIEVFRTLQSEIDGLKAEMDGINATIKEKTSEYERRSSQLNADIISFNSCAEVAGCFETEEEFNERRAVLLSEQQALEGMYNEINETINYYNNKVEIYNADVLESEKLNTIINSAAKPQEVK